MEVLVRVRHNNIHDVNRRQSSKLKLVPKKHVNCRHALTVLSVDVLNVIPFTFGYSCAMTNSKTSVSTS